MCGRFTQIGTWAEIASLYNLSREADKGRNTAPRYNISPTQDVPFVHLDKEGHQIVEDGCWCPSGRRKFLSGWCCRKAPFYSHSEIEYDFNLLFFGHLAG